MAEAGIGELILTPTLRLELHLLLMKKFYSKNFFCFNHLTLNPLKGTFQRAVPFRELKGARGMKKLLLAFLFCLHFSFLKAQWVTIPDTNFVNWLNNNGYASCMNGNLMDTTCGVVVNATKVNCSWSNISSLEGIEYFDELDTLLCQFNNLTIIQKLPDSLKRFECWANYTLSSLPNLPSKLLWLDCGHNSLSSLPVLPDSLKIFYCDDNLLTALPSLSPGLLQLFCADNLLDTLPLLPTSLILIGCSENLLTALPSLPFSLGYLNCGYNMLTNLPLLPDSLKQLSCAVNQIAALPALPNQLVNLICGGNLFTSLPSLPMTLLELNCGNNQLSFLPALPNSLKWLHCYQDQLTSLPNLPDSLEIIWCNDNQLTSLPPIPNKVWQLVCDNNLFTSLPNLPNSLTQLVCNNNQLTALPELPDSLYQLGVHDNPNLSCLPELKEIGTLSFTNTAVQCLPNYGNVTTSFPSLSSLPLCDLFNPNGCDVYWNISGKVYSDTNSNCIDETSEMRLANMKIMLDSAGTLIQQTYTGGEGLYSFDTDTGTYTYTVDTTGLPVMVTCPVSGFQTSVLTALDSMDYDMDFGMQCKPGFDVGVTSVVRDSGVFRPAHFANLRFNAGDVSNFYGLHCATGVTGTVMVVMSGPVSFVSAAAGALVPVVSGDTLFYSITDFGTVNFSSDIEIIVQTDTSAIVGQQICFSVNVAPVTGDINTTNNSLQHCFTVVNSVDPNNKEVFPAGDIDTSQHWLTYTINFQNTGTALAQHIYILDTLDTDFDESTFTLLAYSHQPLPQVVGNIVRFNFPNINLPDSVSDEPNSHGFVQFKIKLKNGLPSGTVIENTAHIIFDFNVPVVTNTTLTTIVLSTSISQWAVSSGQLTVFPNPASGIFEVSVPQLTSDHCQLTIMNLLGEIVFSEKINSAHTQTIKLSALPAGMYQCIVSYNQTRISRKLAVVK